MPKECGGAIAPRLAQAAFASILATNAISGMATCFARVGARLFASAVGTFERGDQIVRMIWTHSNSSTPVDGFVLALLIN